MTQQVRRKKRSDRNHVVYQISCVDGRSYVGITVQTGTVLQSMRRRWLKHVNRALGEHKTWALCEAIRTLGAEAFEIRMLAKVRGKARAHELEVEYIKQIKPVLNTAKTGKGKVHV